MVKCICQICNCGKHRCPHYMPQPVTKSKQPCQFSEYQTMYKDNQNVQRGPIVRPEDMLKNEGEIDYNTTHKDKFPAHMIQKRSDKKQQVKYIKNNAPMDLDTEYGTKYHPGRGDRYTLPDFYKQKTQPYGDGKDRTKKSVTHKDFDPKQIGEKPVIHKMTDNVELSEDPFDHQTTNQVDYTRFQQLPEKTGRRPDNLDTKGLPATYDTTNKEHFVPHKNQQRHQKLPPPSYQPNNKPFYGKSLMKSDYHQHSGAERSEPIRGDNNLFESDQPLNDETTHNTHFQGWEVQKRPAPLEKPIYNKPRGKMDFNKTSDDYKLHGKVAHKAMRPKTNIEFSGDFDGLTSYQDGYIKHGYVKEKPISRQKEYFSSDAPFESVSESQDQYKRFAVPSKSTKTNRESELFDKNAPFINDTSYGDHFQQKKLPQCPSTYIVGNNFSGYKIKDDFASGHRYLIPDSVPSTAQRSETHTPGTPPPLPPIGGGQKQKQQQQQQHQRYVAAH